ncbi:disease resistance protein RPP2A isoform X2 [Arachis hypogaea]
MGIWGMGGVGKTTIAKSVYNQIPHGFDRPMFLPNIREMWENNQQVFLQEQLLNGICKAQINIQNIASGVALLREKLRLKKVFLVLDDVNNIDQLNALCGSPEWFGAGSIIIITTRDRGLLRMIGVDYVYQVKEMDYNESLELFCWNAFGEATPLTEFARLAEDVVKYCGGLPLALITIGCQLYGKMKDEWENVLGGLKRFPHPDVHQVLKISFDGLNDDREKETFLDIASFCIGMERGEVLKTLNYGFGISEHGISFLEERSLITFDEKDRVRMHPLLRDIGREIVREQSQTDAQRRRYDVFVSFRGKDTRPTFTSHLHTSLQNAGITAFKDDDDVDGLQRGERISIALLKAIGLSACSVIVFSTHYADSKWCLQELENIMVCHRTKGQVVYPIFYEVDPSDVRYQKKESEFGKAFESLISRRSVEEDKVQSWRTDLREVSSFSGTTVINSRNESEDIKRIVEHVTRLLDKTELFVAAHPVGVEPRVQKLIEESNIQKIKDVLILGIKGMGGVGKTTIAKAIYNKIRRDFDGRSFLLNIRETWQQDNGKVLLQQQLLEDIFIATRIHISNIDSGKQILKERLGAKRVLIVLDDVTDLDQLNALCGSGEWCRPGSVVIITTRHDDLLRVCKLTFNLEEMNGAESLELFSWHVFKQACPKDKFVKLSTDVVEYSNGLPLALEVLGSHLFNMGIKEWQSALDTLKLIPHDKVQKKLQISFDGLSKNYEKEIFLDIACFFIGMDRNDVVKILNGCGLHAEIGISALKERNLVTVDNNNMLGMHDLLRDMGRAIICEQSPELEERSRLWYDEKVLELLENHEGTDLKAKGLSLKLPMTNSICLSKEAFKNMTKLELLQLAGVQPNGEFKHVSRYLRWMSWHGFPLRHTPIDCYQPNIISIELENSKLKVLWKESRLLKQLKILNLSHSHDLIKTPDFSYLPNLEKLVLKDCTELSLISYTIGTLKNILHINIEGCTNLCVLPRSIYKLTSLETLILSGCLKIDKLEEDVEQMESLAMLKADNTAIAQVPSALARLRNLGHVSVCGYEGLACDVIPLIMFWLWTSPNNMLSSVMQKCSNVFTYANWRPRLQIKGDVSLNTDNVANCNELGMDISEPKFSLNSLLIQMGVENSTTEILQQTILQNNELGDYLLPYDNNNPGLLTFSGEGSFVTFQVLHMDGRNLKSMMLHIVYYSTSSTFATTGLILENVQILNLSRDMSNVFKGDKLASFKDEDREILMSSLEPGDTMRIVVALGSGFIVKKTIVYLIYDDEPPIEENLEHFNDDEDDTVCSTGDDVVAFVNEGTLGVDVIAADDDEDVTVFGVHDAVAGMNEIVSGVDAMAEDKDGVTVANVDDDTVANLDRNASTSGTDIMPPITNGFGANYVVGTDINESSSNVDDNNDDDVAAIGDKNVSDNLYVASVVKRQQVEDISTTKTSESKSTGLIPLVQVPLDANTSSELTLTMMVSEEDELDEDSDLLIAELDKTLSESYFLYPSPGSLELQSLSVISIFQKMQLLLDNELEALVGDVNIKNQLLGYVAQLGQIIESSQVPKDLHSLVTEISHFYEDFLNDFPPVQEVLDNHQRLIDSKNGLQEKLKAAKAKQGHFSASISKGKERVHEMSKEINELEVKLKVLHEKRNRLQFNVKCCEFESININKNLEILIKENEEVVSTLKESESAFRKAELSKQSYERKLAVLKQALYGNTRH